MILVGVTGKLITFSHRNLVISLSFGCSPIWRKAFSMSATIPIFFVGNLISSPQISSKMAGPLCKHSLRFGLEFFCLCGCIVNHTQFCDIVFWFDNCVVWDIVLFITLFLLLIHNFNHALLELIFDDLSYFWGNSVSSFSRFCNDLSLLTLSS